MSLLKVLALLDAALSLAESVGVSVARYQALRNQRKAEGHEGLLPEDLTVLADEADAARARLPDADVP